MSSRVGKLCSKRLAAAASSWHRSASYQGEPGGPGTYIATDDYLALGVYDEPTLRVYGKADSWRKHRTRAGLVVQAPAIIDFLAALVGVYFAAFGDSGTSAVMVADVGQAVIGWSSASDRSRAVPQTGCPSIPLLRPACRSRNAETSGFQDLLHRRLPALVAQPEHGSLGNHNRGATDGGYNTDRYAGRIRFSAVTRRGS